MISTTGEFYGHSHLIALKSSEGYYCYNWWGYTIVAVVLFTDIKVAREWLKKANVEAGKSQGRLKEIVATLTQIKSHPAKMRVAINPSVDAAEIHRVMKKSFWQDW